MSSHGAIVARVVESPIGMLRLSASDCGVTEIWLGVESVGRARRPQLIDHGEADLVRPPGDERFESDPGAEAPGNRRAPSGRGVAGREAEAVLDRLDAQLSAFFAGSLAVFDVAIDAPGTPFQREVWAALMAIPAGQTRSYAEVARAIGRPAAVRAGARANATNPIAIVVPCHRVIGSDGSLTGYGGGLDRKRWLLDHERKWWGAGLFAGV